MEVDLTSLGQSDTGVVDRIRGEVSKRGGGATTRRISPCYKRTSNACCGKIGLCRTFFAYSQVRSLHYDHLCPHTIYLPYREHHQSRLVGQLSNQPLRDWNQALRMGVGSLRKPSCGKANSAAEDEVPLGEGSWEEMTAGDDEIGHGWLLDWKL